MFEHSNWQQYLHSYSRHTLILKYEVDQLSDQAIRESLRNLRNLNVTLVFETPSSIQNY